MAKTQRAVKPRPAPRKSNGLESLRARLAHQRQEIIDSNRHDPRAGFESSEDGTEDIVDRANNAYNRELMLSLSDGERQLLQQIEEALSRFESGGYGQCVHCGETIAQPRLQALPWARLCIDCQELQEKGMLEEA